MQSATKTIRDLLPSVILIINEATELPGVEVNAVHIDWMTGISIFTTDAPSRDNLADSLGLGIEVHTLSVGKGEFREGIVAGFTIRIHGTNRI